MRVLFIAPLPLPYGGIANWMLLMKRYMEKNLRNELVGVINISPGKRDLDGRNLFDRIIKQGFQMFKINRKLKEIIQNKKPEVIHMTTSGQLALIRDIFLLRTIKKNRIKSIYHIRFGRIPEIYKKNTIEYWLLKKAIELADRVIVIDNKTYETLKQPKVIKIANPFENNKVDIIEKKVKLTKTIVFLGWCVKKKGIEELLNAWNEINNKYSDWNLKLIGPIKPKYKEELSEKFSFKQVIWLGEKSNEESLKILNEASIFILPSHTEGFPNSILEAMALGKPIIATNVGAIEEMLDENAGVIVAPQNKDEIRLALEKLIKDEHLRKELGKNAKRRLLENYTIDIIMKKYKEVWESKDDII